MQLSKCDIGQVRPLILYKLTGDLNPERRGELAMLSTVPQLVQQRNNENNYPRVDLKCFLVLFESIYFLTNLLQAKALVYSVKHLN